MSDWLFDTMLWTAGLIALVLLIRRPVAKYFGPQIAYALWAIPAVRLVLPPLELPAWLNPAPEEAPLATAEPATITPFSTFEFVQPEAPAATTSGLDAATGTSLSATPLPLFEFGMTIWLAGAALFLVLRFRNYFKLRRELLEDAIEVGRHGKIRMLETPGTRAPIAFGVVDPVIAMPPGFMAQPNRTARDLALAHEFSHHEAHDLLANVMVQPLFALHWFNPLGRYGWLALRRDQEAACDARVMSATPAEVRGDYATLIASFAAGPKFALAAPMACPVLGEKSIVHRLRSLKMSNMSVRRRLAGRVMVGASLIALPLTASISYAEEAAFPEPPLPPTPTLAMVAPAAPAAPAAPSAVAAPLPPAAPVPFAQPIESVDPGESDAARRVFEEEVEVKRKVAKEKRELAKEKAEKHKRRSIEIRRSMSAGGQFSDEEIEEIMVDVREGLVEAQEALAEARVEIERVKADKDGMRTKVKLKCKSDSDEVAEVVEHGNGQQTVYLCQARVMAQALTGLREAREAIARNREITGKMRSELLETLDEQIREWEKAERTSAFPTIVTERQAFTTERGRFDMRTFLESGSPRFTPNTRFQEFLKSHERSRIGKTQS